MIDYSTVDNTTGAFPNVASQNATGPGETDGTPYNKAVLDDLWGARQAIMDAAGMTPNGVAEAATTSQILAAIKQVVRLMLAAERTDIGGVDSVAVSTTASGIYGAGHATGPGGGGGAGPGGEFVGGYAADGIIATADTNGDQSGGVFTGAWGITTQGYYSGIYAYGNAEGATGGEFHGSDAGTTSAPGIAATGGNSGPGGVFVGGSGGGVGVSALGGAAGGKGGYFLASAGGNDDGIYSRGYGSGTGIDAKGGDTGIGVSGKGGNTGGMGGAFQAIGGNYAGVGGIGHGTAAGGVFTGGADGPAIMLLQRSGSPSSLSDGAMWIDSATSDLKIVINSAIYTISKTP